MRSFQHSQELLMETRRRVKNQTNYKVSNFPHWLAVATEILEVSSEPFFEKNLRL